MAYTPSEGASGEKKDLTDRLKALNTEQEERLAEYRAGQLGLPYVNLVMFPINSEALRLIPKSQAEKAQAVLFYRGGKDTRLAAVQPNTPEAQQLIQNVENQIGNTPEVYAVSPRSIASAIARYPKETVDNELPENELRVEGSEVAAATKALDSFKELGKRITSLPPTEILQSIVVHAVAMGASDVHIEPREADARLRFRVDGVLQDITSFARDGWALILSRVKVLSGLKLNVRDVPQDGSFILKVEEKIYDLRVSVLPGGTGENIVMRILDRESQAVAITDLGMKKRDYDVVEEELQKVNGMILVTGPTGSGKTTTLASFINQVNQPELKIITLEDPIEYRLPGVEQTQIDTSSGYTFAKGLRSILRQDPDMILVGEMRDEETVETAIHASLTGHLVFSTLHTNNAAGAIPRLVNMGAKAQVLAPALNMIIAQRLVRKLCEGCATEYTPTAAQREKIQFIMQGVRSDVFDVRQLTKKNLTFLQAGECSDCVGGYKGRVGVFEVFQVNQDIENLIIEGADEGKVLNAALEQGMTTIAQDGYIKVLNHITTIDEVERISQE